MVYDIILYLIFNEYSITFEYMQFWNKKLIYLKKEKRFAFSFSGFYTSVFVFFILVFFVLISLVIVIFFII
jgi:hypothetical protein